MTSSAQDASKTTTLVLGATGATGKWVVKQLLDQGQSVKVVVRSKDRMESALKEISSDGSLDTKGLTITEASMLELSDSDLQSQVQGCDAVVSCLGHNLSFKGMWGRQGRKLVTEMAQRVTKAIDATGGKTKFILMGSDGVAHPNGQDDPRSMGERFVLFLLRCLIPPHVDNEEAAAFVHSLGESPDSLEWSVVRPTDLIDGPPTGKYQLFDKPQGGLFGAGVATRSHVAHSMVELILNDAKWQQYKYKMPVLHDLQPDEAKSEL